jgi:hypothetical protein
MGKLALDYGFLYRTQPSHVERLTDISATSRTIEIVMVPATTQTAAKMGRNFSRSMSRRNSYLPRTIHKGLMATIGETVTT